MSRSERCGELISFDQGLIRWLIQLLELPSTAHTGLGREGKWVRDGDISNILNIVRGDTESQEQVGK